MKLIKLASLIFLASLTACSTIILEPADFSWPVESVIPVDDEGNISAERYSFTFNAKGLFFEEAGDSLAYLDRELRIIRDSKGFYYMTASNFKYVYVFNDAEGAFRMENKILISESGIGNPAFNQRQPYIEFIDGNRKLYLSNEGIKENEEE